MSIRQLLCLHSWRVVWLMPRLNIKRISLWPDHLAHPDWKDTGIRRCEKCSKEKHASTYRTWEAA